MEQLPVSGKEVLSDLMAGGIEDCKAGSMLECGGGADNVDGSRMAALCQL